MRRLIRRASRLVREQAHSDNRACGASGRCEIDRGFWRLAPRPPRALCVLALCVLAGVLFGFTPPRSGAEAQRSALSRPHPVALPGSQGVGVQSGQAGATSQPSPLAQTRPIIGDHAVFSRITTEQGLSDPRAVAIVQDHIGFMWFGTVNGLDRYDGYNIVAYRNDPANPYSLSGNFIEALYEDRSGTLWVGTRSGLNAFDRRTERFTRYVHDPADSRSLSNSGVVAIYEDRAGVLWIGTRGGLNRFDRASGSFTAFRHDEANPQSLSNDIIYSIYEDHTGVLWIATDGGGLNRFDRATNTFTQYRHDPNDPHSLSMDRLESLFEDSSGALWIGTFGGGLSVLDPARRTFATYRRDLAVPTALSEDYVTDIVADRSGMIWIGTIGGGVNLYSPRPQAFTLYQYDPKASDSLASDRIDGVYEDRDGVVWVGTQDRGLDRFDRRTGQVVHYPPDPENPQRLGYPFVRAIQQDLDGALWVGTWGGGLYRLDQATGNFTAYRHDPANPYSLSDDNIYVIHMDRFGTLWVATAFGGLNRLDPKTGAFTAYRNDPSNPQSLSNDTITAVEEDQRGNIWIGTFGGGLNRLDAATGQITRYQHDPNNPASLGDDNIFDLHLDRSGVLWVGLSGAGLDRFDPAQGMFTHYREGDGLASDRVVSIMEDGDAGDPAAGNLWIVTGRGLSKLDTDRKTFHTYGTADGLPLAEYNRGHLKTRSGQLLFGSSQGLIAFDPAAVQGDTYVPPVVFTNFLLANQPAPIADGSPLKQAIDQSDTIELTYADRIVSFEFAALSYQAPRRNRYRYKLEGFDQEWIEADATRRLVTYTNLNPGTYVFRVTGSNADGVWNDAGRAITLVVTPPWWATWWFRSLAVALVAGLGTALYILRVNSIKAQGRRLEIQVAQRTRELMEKTTELEVARDQAESANRAKSMFLATMSHELRTPLNVILGFAQILTRGSDLPPKQREYLATIQRSGAHLLDLINTVLDLAKIEAGRATLHETTIDLVGLSDDLELLFRQQAADKGLELRVERAATVPRYVRADALKLRQVLVNLLGNAVKFTESGSVTLRLTTDHRPMTNDQRPTTNEDSGLKIEDSDVSPDETRSSILDPRSSDHLSFVVRRSSLVVFAVEDTGPGIAPEEQAQIFEAFVQTTAGVQTRKGTGLGLAISRQFVRLMGGTLEVHSQPGQGARFTVTLPLQVAAPATVELPDDSRRIVALAPGQPPSRLLVVDDEADNRNLLITLLAPLGFELREARDGQEAVALARDWQPQLIWMDLRMPLLDGYTAARQIKASADGRPPVIIAVSASSTADERAAVLADGCDDFISKPYRDSEIFAALARYLGVRYIYADEPQAGVASPSSAAPAHVEMDAEALAALPADVLDELERAIVDGDPVLIGQCIARVRAHNAALADELAARADRFEHARMLARIEAARGLHG